MATLEQSTPPAPHSEVTRRSCTVHGATPKLPNDCSPHNPGRRAEFFMELPRYCGYWKYTSAQRLLERRALRQCTFDGCTRGLTTADGARVKKPWKAMCLSSTLQGELSHTCSGDRPHAHRATKEFTGTQVYTMHNADIVHRHIARCAETIPGGPRPAAASPGRACTPCSLIHRCATPLLSAPHNASAEAPVALRPRGC